MIEIHFKVAYSELKIPIGLLRGRLFAAGV